MRKAARSAKARKTVCDEQNKRKHADEISLITQKEHFKNTKICFNLKEAIWSLTKKKKKTRKKS